MAKISRLFGAKRAFTRIISTVNALLSLRGLHKSGLRVIVTLLGSLECQFPEEFRKDCQRMQAY